MKNNLIPKQIFAVNYAGFYQISDEDSYDGNDILDAEEVGLERAEACSKEVVKRFNMHDEVMDALLALVRESALDTKAVKNAVELLNRNKE